MYSKIYEAMTGKEAFEGGSTFADMLAAGIVILLVLVIQLFVIQWLWNTVLTRSVSVVRPLPSLLHTLGLLILLVLVHPGVMCV
jgi:hypothetical protein